PPTPEHLNTRTPDRPWSTKALHRLILLSNAYQMSSAEDARVLGIDPDNKLLTRQNRRRLEAEEIRDTLLAVSGELDPTMGGAHPFPPVSTWGYTQHTPFTAVYETQRRSIYLMSQRIRKHPFLALFDGAEPNGSTPERVATTTPIQALFALNDPFVHDQAAALARRLQAAGPDPAGRVDRAYRLCLGRPAGVLELREGTAFLTAARAAVTRSAGSGDPTSAAELELRALTAFARVLLGSNELFFVD
ncbi:MAG: Planctomycete cytochrome, partial [Armatimonadetes bacterium]|nr:Planctomycete cytochrome [Armatimonadota bacterium]